MSRNIVSGDGNNVVTIARYGEKLTWDGAGGTDTLSFDRLGKSYFKIKPVNADGYIEIDSVSGASAFYQIFVKNVERLVFSNGSTVVNIADLYGPDATAPTVTSFSPADEASTAPINGDIAVTFSESIQIGTGSIVIKDAGNTVIETIDVATSPNVSISGRLRTLSSTWR